MVLKRFGAEVGCSWLSERLSVEDLFRVHSHRPNHLLECFDFADSCFWSDSQPGVRIDFAGVSQRRAIERRCKCR